MQIENLLFGIISQFPEILKAGLLGLMAIVIYLFYRIIATEQNHDNPRTQILAMSWSFIGLATIIVVAGLILEFRKIDHSRLNGQLRELENESQSLKAKNLDFSQRGEEQRDTISSLREAKAKLEADLNGTQVVIGMLKDGVAELKAELERVRDFSRRQEMQLAAVREIEDVNLSPSESEFVERLSASVADTREASEAIQNSINEVSERIQQIEATPSMVGLKVAEVVSLDEEVSQASIKTYTGYLGSSRIRLDLEFSEESIEGTYEYPELNEDRDYQVTGYFAEDRSMRLTRLVDGEVDSHLVLEWKNENEDLVVWEGKLKKISDGATFPVRFWRPKS
ncbi:MAG: hypothetical protein AAGC74_12860 [Verrucomicrobiota bacterium]